MKMLSNKNDGFSLISSMIAMGMVGTIAAGMGSLFQMQAKGNKNIEYKIDLQNLRAQISSVLSVQASCDTAFQKLDGSKAKYTTTGTTLDLDRLVNVVGSSTILLAEKGESISPGQVVSDIWFEYQKDVSGAFVPAQSDTPAAGQATHFVELNLRVTRTNSLGGSEASIAPLKMSIVTNASTDEIVACDGLVGESIGGTLVENWISYPNALPLGSPVYCDPDDESGFGCSIIGYVSNKSPTEACQSAGFDSYAGQCSAPGVVGTIAAIKLLPYPYSGNYWRYSCGGVASGSTQLLCKSNPD